MTPKALACFLGALFVALAESSWGQKAANWRVYKVGEGLPQSACISVTVSPHGRVLARHYDPPLLSELNGYSLNTFPAPEEGSSRVSETVGNHLWTVVADGFEEFRGGVWLRHRVPEMAAQARATGIPFCPFEPSAVLFLLPDHLFEFNVANPDHPLTLVLRPAAQTPLARFTDMAVARDGGLWVAGARGLAKLPGPLRDLTPETPWREFTLPEGLENPGEPHEDDAGGVTLVAESGPNHEKVVAHFDGRQWRILAARGERLRQAWQGPDRTLWASSFRMLLEQDGGRAEMSENEEISARQYYDVASEPNGVFWLATSEGLFRYAPLTWSCPQAAQALKTLVHCLAGDEEGRLWFVSGNGVHLLENDTRQDFPFPQATMRGLAARAMYLLKNGALVLDMVEDLGPEKESRGQLFEFRAQTAQFKPLSSLSDARQLTVLGLTRDGNLCVQSRNPTVPDEPYRLERYDGSALLPESAPDPVLGPGLLGSFLAQNGDFWLSGERGLARSHDGKWQTFTSTDGTIPRGVLCFAELADGRLWGATRDQVWEFDGRSWSVLRRGFDRINALVRSRDGSVWVASNGGLQRSFQGAWVENATEEGLPSTGVRDIYEDPRGRLWAGTTRGLSLYHPQADPDPPQVAIRTVSDPDTGLTEGAGLTLMFSGQDKWKYTPRERLLYSYRLDDRDWSPFRDVTSAFFADLAAGKHYFQVRVMDRNCNVAPNPARLEFSIIVPWYKETRLVSISAAGMAAVVFFAGLAYNRHRRLVRSHAEVEKKVTERTRELEIANRELLHSQKMNALGTLAAGIAHDFNNILSIVKGSAQLIEDNLANPQKIQTRVERIKTVVEQGAGIVRAMLGFSRDSEGPPVLAEINSVVRDTIRLLGDRFLREVQVSFQPGRELPQVLAQKDFIQQILLNFIFNAADAATDRKQIILATRRLEQLPADLVLLPASASTHLAISVQDFGTGIAPENLTRIFEPFFTTKALSAHRGTGLGLSMAYELAKKIGAGLAVQTAVAQGSTFTLILPVSEAPAPVAPATPDSLPSL